MLKLYWQWRLGRSIKRLRRKEDTFEDWGEARPMPPLPSNPWPEYDSRWPGKDEYELEAEGIGDPEADGWEFIGYDDCGAEHYAPRRNGRCTW